MAKRFHRQMGKLASNRAADEASRSTQPPAAALPGHCTDCSPGQRRNAHQRGRRHRPDDCQSRYPPSAAPRVGSIRPSHSSQHNRCIPHVCRAARRYRPQLTTRQLSESTKNWRDAWTAILLTETKLAEGYWALYQTIPRTGDSVQPPEETPQDVLDRIKELHDVYLNLKNDMMEEVVKVDGLVINPLKQCAVSEIGPIVVGGPADSAISN